MIVDGLTGEEKLVSGALPIQKLIATISGMIDAHEKRTTPPAEGAANGSSEAGRESSAAISAQATAGEVGLPPTNSQ